MIVLALDTTSRPGSLAVLRDGVLVASRAADASRSHGQQLPEGISALLREEGLQIGDVALYAVAIGPGSFTGLRVGVATVQGLAMVHDRRVVGVSALAALAWWGRSKSAGPWAPWIDAQRGEVFASLYARSTGPAAADTGATELLEVDPPRVGRPAEVIEAWRRQSLWQDAPPVFLGSGAARHRDWLQAAVDGAVIVDESPLLAGAVGELGMARAALGNAVSAHGIAPLYVRRPDAELARERLDDRR